MKSIDYYYKHIYYYDSKRFLQSNLLLDKFEEKLKILTKATGFLFKKNDITIYVFRKDHFYGINLNYNGILFNFSDKQIIKTDHRDSEYDNIIENNSFQDIFTALEAVEKMDYEKIITILKEKINYAIK